MSDVDYSQYYVKFSSSGNKKAKVEPEEPKEPEKKVSKQRRARRGSKGTLFSVVMILICFATTFLLAGVLNRETLAAAFQKTPDYFAYALASKVPDKGGSGLNELSKFVRAGGGGGNLMRRGEDYYVVHAVYLNKKDAQTVQARDKTSEIFGLVDKPFATDVVELKPYAQQFNEEKANLIKKLYAETVENTKTGDDDASIKIMLKMQEPFMTLKQKILQDKALLPANTLPILVAIDTIMGRIEGLTAASATRISLVSDMRYQLYAICVA